MKIMRVLAIVGAGMVATAAAQATSTTGANPLTGQDHKVRQCTAGYCLQASTGTTVQ